jgi:hypothetical protein
MEHWNNDVISNNTDSFTLHILQKDVIPCGPDSKKWLIIVLEGHDHSYCQNCFKQALPKFDFQPILTSIRVEKLVNEILYKYQPDIEGIHIVGPDLSLQKYAINRFQNQIKADSQLKIQLHTCPADIDGTDDDDNDNDTDNKKNQCLTENLSKRELRKRITIQLKNKYRAGHLQCVFPLFKREYEETLLKLTPSKLYTIHDIICFSYLENYAPVDSLYHDLTPEQAGESLNNLVHNVSLIHTPLDVQNEDIDVEKSKLYTDKTESHFKGYSVTCRRKLKKIFEYVLDEESNKKMFDKSSEVIFTMLDYNFILYLLSDDAETNINALVKGKYEEIDLEFRFNLLHGLLRLEQLHGLHFQKDKLSSLWKSR